MTPGRRRSELLNGLQLQTVQSRLMDVGSAVATPLENSSDRKLKRASFDSTAAPLLESWIDAMDEELPPLTNFILPSGTCFPSASKPRQQHLCLA